MTFQLDIVEGAHKYTKKIEEQISFGLMTHKYKREFGMDLARNLMKLYEKFNINWSQADVLDFGCHWGYFPLYLSENKEIRSVVGIDTIDHWNIFERIHSEALGLNDKVKLKADDLLTSTEFKDQEFDVIHTSDTLSVLSIDYLEEVVTWFYDHLKPGGCLLANCRTILSHNAEDYQAIFKKNPFIHLLLSKNQLSDVQKDFDSPNFNPNCVPYSGSTYIMLFKQAGFEIDHVERIKNPHLDWLISNHKNKINSYDSLELSTHEIIICCKKTKDPFPLDDYYKLAN